jgi:RNA polymerase sigma factor (sigma-70 family)
MAARGGNDAGAAAGPGWPSARVDGLRLGRRAKRGERAAFAEIYRRHHQELYRYCLAIVHDRDDAEDAMQATMVAALRALPGEEREIAVRPWLFRVAHNESVSILRRRRERDPDVAALPDPGASQEAELATRERLRGLVADLGELPDRQRAAIVMRELSGLSDAEIGAALSCSPAAARQAVYEARTALREREEGREMECERVRAAVSDRDGRRLRSRRMRAHLKACDGCRGFAASIAQRRSDLQALCPPLPAAAAATILGGLAGGAGSGAGGLGAAGAAGAGAAGGGLAATAAVKGGSLVAALAIAAGAAEIGGVMPDLPGPLGSGADREATRSVGGNGDGALAAPEAVEQPPPAAAGGLERTGGRGGNPEARGGGRGETGGGQGGAGDAREGSGGSGARPGGGGDTDPVAPGGGGGSPASNAGGGGRSTAPGQTGTSPGGGTATAPGQTGTAGSSGSAPGRTGTAGSSGSAPGRTQPTGSASAPGRTGEPPAAAGGGSGRGGNSSK